MANNAIITVTAREKLVRARAGAAQLPPIVGMVFGTGGVDSGGVIIPPQEAQTALTHEIIRKAISKYEFIEPTKCRYECVLEEAEAAGYAISEIGLYDSDGDIVCIKTFSAKGKDSDLEMTFTMDDIF